MLGTFNQHLPMILSNNYWHQSKPVCKTRPKVLYKQAKVALDSLHLKPPLFQVIICQNF